MQLRHLQQLVEPSQQAQQAPNNKVTALCFSPNGARLAVCCADRVVSLFDSDGVRRDKFSTKPNDKGPRNYIVRAMVFSPDSTKLAIAQTDNIVFVYKIGLDWDDKKSICNKFVHSCPITALAWPQTRPNELYYGLFDGKVKVGHLKSHKHATLYASQSYVTSMAADPQGRGIVTGHLDGTVRKLMFDRIQHGGMVIMTHSCIPYALSWGVSIIVAGNDKQVVFIDENGMQETAFDNSNDPNCREYTVAACNPSGDTVVLGNFDAFYVYSKNKDTQQWQATQNKRVQNMYTVTALAWKPDGSKLAVGALCGLVDLYDVCLRRSIYKGKFEFTYVSHSQVIVKQLSTGMRIVLRSQHGCEILKINIFQDQFVVANTTETLLLGDLDSLKLSEIRWHGDGSEKYIFDNPGVCLVSYAGEVSLIEYGQNHILGTVRTAHVSAHLLSVRINERPGLVDDENHRGGAANDDAIDNKKVAYLMDVQTICLKDLVTQRTNTVSHDSKVDWLELNGRANLLLFRDKRRQLHLYNCVTQVRNTLLNYCGYAQWVPRSDVVVAQNRATLCVWYHPMSPEQVTTRQITGDVIDIERGNGETKVIVDEGAGAPNAEYQLDEALIEFSTAVDNRDFRRAVDILEAIEMTAEAEAMWQHLQKLALGSDDLLTAERCAAALGDVATMRYLHKLNKLKAEVAQTLHINPDDYYKVQARLAFLRKDMKTAEDLYMLQNKVQECIEMYQSILQFDDAIRVAESAGLPEADDMRQEYFRHLTSTGQEQAAAAWKLEEGDLVQAIQLYLRAGLPAHAAQVILDRRVSHPSTLLDDVADALVKAGLFEKAGEFYQEMGDLQRSMELYLRGNAFRRAVELARSHFPGQVVQLQEKWGDYLMEQRQIDMAINHFIEANVYDKAIEAALSSSQFNRALELADAIDVESARPYYRQLGEHFEETQQYNVAERCYVAAGQVEHAVKMYSKIGQWDVARKLAHNYMSEDKMNELCRTHAQALAQENRLEEAEKLYLMVGEFDRAINMYKEHRAFGDMIRLVAEHRPAFLKKTHQFLASEFEKENNLLEAENHYLSAGEPTLAVSMYSENGQWEDAIRLAKQQLEPAAYSAVAFDMVVKVGPVRGAKLLQKHNLMNEIIGYCAERGEYETSLRLAQDHMPHKLSDVHYKYALFLEDEERYRDAEEAFLKASKPREAIDMYVHQGDWDSACRVAELYDPAALSDVYIAQGRSQAEAENYQAAEELFIQASKPEYALAMYQQADLLEHALRVAQRYLPHRVAEVNQAYQTSKAQTEPSGASKNAFIAAARGSEQARDWAKAIDIYLGARVGALHPDELEQLWERAVLIARNNLPDRFVQVSVEVSNRLAEIGKIELASEVLFEANRHEEAIYLCLNAHNFTKARELARGTPLAETVEQSYQRHLKEQGQAEALYDEGNTNAAFEVLKQRGEWDNLWRLADKEKLGAVARAEYAIAHAQALTQAQPPRLDEAVEILCSRGAPSAMKYMNEYNSLVRAVLGRTHGGDSGDTHLRTVGMLRGLLVKLATDYRKLTPDSSVDPDLEELLLATHYTFMHLNCAHVGLLELAAKSAITLLRYSDVIPVDKLYYQAGMACKALDTEQNCAFLLLSRYIDLSDAIAQGSDAMLENGAFQECDNIPADFVLPQTQYIPDKDTREAVRDWILEMCAYPDIGQELPAASSARGTLYEGLYASDRPTCIVTGYPVHAIDMLQANGSVANKRDWNAYVGKTKRDPWTDRPEKPRY